MSCAVISCLLWNTLTVFCLFCKLELKLNISYLAPVVTYDPSYTVNHILFMACICNKKPLFCIYIGMKEWN